MTSIVGKRRIIKTDEFERGVATLGSPAAQALAHALAERIAVKPELAPQVAGLPMRALRSRGYGEYPALRLFYTFDEQTLYLLTVERYDELS